MGVGGCDAGAIELRRRQRQLVALARGAELPGSLHIKTVALAPAARQSAVDIDVDAEIGAFRADFVGGDHVIDQRLDKGRFVEIEKGVAGRLGGRRRLGGCWACAVSGVAIASSRWPPPRRSTTARFQKIAPVESLLFHGRFPLPAGDVAPGIFIGTSMLLLPWPGKAGLRGLLRPPLMAGRPFYETAAFEPDLV